MENKVANTIIALHDRKAVSGVEYSSFTKDDCISRQLPGCYLEQDKQGNRFHGTACVIVGTFE